ncbi:MAG TPA: tripartite tricarboxylate transporter substrate binding protein [Burkholderiales bacterium]|nr:tripartite tricarboxylate transporter substrate binding protein [Burkholderiales bacterium]
MTSSRTMLTMLAIAGGLVGNMAGNLAAGAAHDYPIKPLRLIVPFPPGGGNDILARSVGQRLSEIVGQQIIVDNRGGAGGLIGAELAAKAVPDGYTIFLASIGNLAFTPALRARLPYDPVTDFAPVTLLATSAFIMVVNPAVPAKSVSELIALAKARPGTLNYASAGQGSSLHMTAEIFKLATATDLVHVAYKGSAPALTDLVAGQVQVMFGTMPATLPQVKAGKLRALGVSGARRSAAAPDVPTIAEAGVPGFEVLNWYGIVAPSKTPAEIVQKLNRNLLAVLKSPQMIESLHAQGLEAAGGTPERFAAFIKSEIAKYAKVVKAANIRAE